MRRDFKLYLDPLSGTGISLVPSEGALEVTDVGQLPEFRIEVHGFTSHQRAIDFMDGVLAAGGNRVACSRAEGVPEGKFVVVAHTSEGRHPGDALEEAVPLIDHPPSGEEGRMVARHLKERIARDEQEFEERSVRVRPVLADLQEAGFDAAYDGNRNLQVQCWVKEKNPLGWRARMFVEPAQGKNGFWVVGSHLFGVGPELSGLPADQRVLDAVGRHGFASTDGGETFVSDAVPLEDVPSVVARAGAAWAEVTKVCRVLHQERLQREQEEKRRLQRGRARERRRTAKERQPEVSGS